MKTAGTIVSGVTLTVVLSGMLFPSMAMAKVYVVGDDKGWGPGVDYQTWAASKFFSVGDILGRADKKRQNLLVPFCLGHLPGNFSMPSELLKTKQAASSLHLHEFVFSLITTVFRQHFAIILS